MCSLRLPVLVEAQARTQINIHVRTTELTYSISYYADGWAGGWVVSVQGLMLMDYQHVLGACL